MAEESKRRRRHLNAAERRALKSAEMAQFLKAAGRKAQKGVEPNDRRYEDKFAKALRRVDPADIDRIMRDDED